MNYIKKHFLVLGLIILFTLSRWYIFTNPPANYSDVKADYERYANAWRYGLPPYLKYLYEYPPATIPLLSFPLTLDQAGIGKYYPNYRTQILVIDVIFFAYLIFITGKIPWLNKRRVQSLLIYIVLTTFAKDFFYEGIDLAFTSSAIISFTLLYFMPTDKNSLKSWVIEILIWTFFWLSVGIKFLTFPLGLPLFLLLHRGKINQQVIACFIGFLLIWGAPLAIYRSSLQVMFVHNNNRPIKYASFPAHIIRWINSFTHTEQQRMVAPDFEYQGPISNQVTSVNKVVFPLAVVGVVSLMGALILLQTLPKKEVNIQSVRQYIFSPLTLTNISKLSIMIWVYLIYIFTLFITAKIFSQPFHIWYIAPIILVPFQKTFTWYFSCGLCLLMILLDMTPLLHIKNNVLIGGSVEIALIRDLFRFIPMFVILYIAFREMKQEIDRARV